MIFPANPSTMSIWGTSSSRSGQGLQLEVHSLSQAASSVSSIVSSTVTHCFLETNPRGWHKQVGLYSPNGCQRGFLKQGNSKSSLSLVFNTFHDRSRCSLRMRMRRLAERGVRLQCGYLAMLGAAPSGPTAPGHSEVNG